MKKKSWIYKSGVIVLGLLVLVIIVVTSSPTLNRNLSRNLENNIENIKVYVAEKLPWSNGANNGNMVGTTEEYYNIVKAALDNFETTVTIAVKNYDKKIINEDVFNKALETSPLSGPGFTCHMTVQELGNSTTTVKLEFGYPESREVMKEKTKAVEAKVRAVVSELVKPEMKDYEKERVLHDYLVTNCKYDERYFTGDMPDESYTAYSALIDGIGVCQAYAVAMNLLLNEAGIESMLIAGEGYYPDTKDTISHAWNLVKIGGEFYHLDPTWNDPVMENGKEILTYTYFNLTDEQMEINHKWDKTEYPPCTATEYTFSNLNFVEKDENGNDIKVVKNLEEFSQSLEKDMQESKASVTYRVVDFKADFETIERYIIQAYEKTQLSGKYSYGYRVDEITKCGYVLVEFQWE